MSEEVSVTGVTRDTVAEAAQVCGAQANITDDISIGVANMNIASKLTSGLFGRAEIEGYVSGVYNTGAGCILNTIIDNGRAMTAQAPPVASSGEPSPTRDRGGYIDRRSGW